ncbi:MAG: 1-deoxy-D-xylulose-5-phosphate reductoisomerase [Clostridia bacterium]|nr:1-deoxy-D-xylulose-5-phosphate reductoisomerase [Clostridia bacterium]
MMKKICLLGSTGSIGTQTLEICRALSLPVTGLCANRATDLFEAQVREFQPRIVALSDPKAAHEMKARLSDLSLTVLGGADAPERLAEEVDTDLVVNAMGGIVGLAPSLAAVRRGITLATANKESIVAGGHFIREVATKNNATILPIDSEHSAMFQCMQGKANSKTYLSRLLLTASGGPFKRRSVDELWDVTPEEAANHPVWKMGKKVSVDSATLMNKGLELIEAVRLFDVNESEISVLIHPQSIIHSMAEFCDGSIIAQLGAPDMRTCIKFALTYPERCEGLNQPLSFEQLDLNFSVAKEGDFPMVDLARDAIRRGGGAPCALNAADEAAIALFLKQKIRFPEIYTTVAAFYDRYKHETVSSPEDVLRLDAHIKGEITDNGR